jgi:aldehyde:ferredoxin oxidoreductase
MISYDYEPIYALGSMLGISDAGGLLKLIDLVEVLGLDAMSTGVILAWATEAQERKLISLKETIDIKLSWGDCASYMEAIRLIVEQPNDFYRALARGADHASRIYGGSDFALSFGGNEMPGYHTGPGAYAGILIGARHSHLDNAGYSFDQKLAGDNLPEPMDMISALLKEEQWRQVLSSLVICFFARGVYSADVTIRALQTAGFNLSSDDLLMIGREIHANKYKFKIREGFDLDLQTLPKRIFETGTPVGNLDGQYMSDAVTGFKKLMGFS